MKLNFQEWLFLQEMSRYYGTDIDWQNDQPDDIIQKISSIPCGETPPADTVSPGVVATFGVEDLKDLMCVLKGEKRVAWVKASKLAYPGTPLRKVITKLLAAAKKKGLAVIPQDFQGYAPGWVVGSPSDAPDVKSLADVHDKFVGAYNTGLKDPTGEKTRIPAHLHRLMGRALGYKPSDVEGFIKGQDPGAICQGPLCDVIQKNPQISNINLNPRPRLPKNPKISNVPT